VSSTPLLGTGVALLVVRVIRHGTDPSANQVDVDHYESKADDSLYEPGEGSLVGQFGPEGSRVRACCDLVLVELCAQRSARLATQGDLICESCHWGYASQSVVDLAVRVYDRGACVVTRYRVIGVSMCAAGDERRLGGRVAKTGVVPWPTNRKIVPSPGNGFRVLR